MADKMMRIAGRGEDGTAKAIKTDNVGNIGAHIVNSDIDLVGNTTLKGNAEFAAGTTSWINNWGSDFSNDLPFLDVSKYSSFNVTVTAEIAHNFELGYFSWRDSDNNNFPSTIGNVSSNGGKTIQIPFNDIEAYGLRCGIINKETTGVYRYTINVNLRNNRKQTSNTVKKFENSDFAYSNPGFRFFGNTGPSSLATAETLDVSMFKNKAIIINNRHTDTAVNVVINIASKGIGLYSENEIGTLISDTISPGENKLYYPSSHPELNVPAPGLLIGIQRQSAPVVAGLGIDVYILGGV